ncbi:LPXTG cell wall anchor domain-containing protein [Corynebacterium amycolatum]|nr:LPXTG cell wall anchor domain-containing protein [Corynebacterium jeikeium]KAA0880271.1 LPXTG cell wall anchor domain-containing protein [Corynebacterium amycolatum]KAA9225749.1 LPXTG cell wall anchor domain-containing protein [Corynebacterium amycolatum]
MFWGGIVCLLSGGVIFRRRNRASPGKL